MILNGILVRSIIVGAWSFVKSKLPPEGRRKLGTFLGRMAQKPLITSLVRWYDQRSVDAYLISFPKSGRTWLRLMIGRVLEKHLGLTDPKIMERILELETLAPLHPDVPKIRVIHDDEPEWKKPDELVQSKANYKNAKVILLVRDPRDVVVSIYFEHTKRVGHYAHIMQQVDSLKQYAERIKPYEGDLPSFIHESVGSFDTLIRYYNIWEANRYLPKDFLLVRYEDIQTNTKKELKRVLEFLGVKSVRNEVIEEAVNFASFKNMRQMEQNRTFKSDRLTPTDQQYQESYKTRKGKVGGFTEYLNQEDIDYLNSKMEENLSYFYHYKP
ncbi:MAG: sulfotransferase domain-containing protein [Moorea sp. SIO3I7]|uniref:sulfotransferase domain-containing protein n=1 Tax=Moorena sp. SIO3I8 TaxID=2607833 RepID=UPI0013C1D856|nr:sulfotransferase domain-containing protein [Moorena sp. SIO3I8]NEN98520.1 sulfotransferase domain-containing protein [Moorena sp. SIO3I7]NEO09636.1 sulfotransferase domain-containing protein [Moorena sp. SIO3I8]